MLIISKYCEYDVSSIWAQLKPYLRRCCEVLPEVTRSEVTSVTWPELTPVTCRVRKYVLRMRNRKLHHIRPSVTFWPKVTSITWPEDMPCPEVALIESRLCACAAFSRVFFLLAVVTWLPDVTKGHLNPSGFPSVCACTTESCATPVVVVNNVGWGVLFFFGIVRIY